MECGRVVQLLETPLRSLPPYCVCGYAQRPDVVQFGEPIDAEVLTTAYTASRQAELFLVAGTSGVVSPASNLPLMALQNGAKVVEVNPEPTVLTRRMTCHIQGKAAEVIPPLWKELFNHATHQKHKTE